VLKYEDAQRGIHLEKILKRGKSAFTGGKGEFDG